MILVFDYKFNVSYEIFSGKEKLAEYLKISTDSAKGIMQSFLGENSVTTADTAGNN